MSDFIDTLIERPIVAILRGVSPAEVVPVAEALVVHGIRILEVPLNSPEPYRSVRLLAERFGGDAIVGAGTVLRPAEVDAVAQAGGRLIVSPNFNPEVVAATKAAGMISVPGVLTPSEAFAALDAQADALKLFPGDMISPKVVAGLRAVLPPGARIVVTGGVGADSLGAFLAAGADGAGIGSALYRPGDTAGDVTAKARRFAEAINLVRDNAAE